MEKEFSKNKTEKYNMHKTYGYSAWTYSHQFGLIKWGKKSRRVLNFEVACTRLHMTHTASDTFNSSFGIIIYNYVSWSLSQNYMTVKPQMSV